jgi:hypothetical protein
MGILTTVKKDQIPGLRIDHLEIGIYLLQARRIRGVGYDQLTTMPRTLCRRIKKSLDWVRVYMTFIALV